MHRPCSYFISKEAQEVRVGLLGGTFDPVHNGHLEIAVKALQQRHLDEVWFVVAKVSPFKQLQYTAPFSQRLAMVRLMIASHHRFKACTIDDERSDVSYTIDTIDLLQKRFPAITFSWIIGSDQASEFNQWKDYAEILNRVDVLVYPRSVTGARDERFSWLDGEINTVSSTDIRSGNSFETSPNVLRYMMENSLYTEEMLKQRLSQQRFDHTLSMTDCALDIARSYPALDLRDVRLAGLMHDSCKELSKEAMGAFLKQVNPSVALKHPNIWHGSMAAYTLSKYYSVKNKAVLRAIAGHVEGTSTHPLGLVLYLADKCDPGRGLHRDQEIKLAKTNLIKAFHLVKEDAERYRKGKEKNG